MFVIMFFCFLDLKRGWLEYCNAGHSPPVIGTADGHFSFLETEPDVPIGLWPDQDYEGTVIDNLAYHRILLYTDGLNEAENRQQEQYGEDCIISFLTARASFNAHDIIEALKADVENFRDGAEPSDDLTLFAFHYND